MSGGSLSNGWNTIGTIPSGYKSLNNFDFIIWDNGNSYGVQGKIKSDGELQIYKTSSVSNNIRAFCTYIK